MAHHPADNAIHLLTKNIPRKSDALLAQARPGRHSLLASRARIATEATMEEYEVNGKSTTRPSGRQETPFREGKSAESTQKSQENENGAKFEMPNRLKPVPGANGAATWSDEKYERELRNARYAGVGTLASDVEQESINWLWQSWLPIGELSILDGDPGLGKSTLTCEIAARLTTGRELPPTSPQKKTKPCGVVMVGAEDSPGHTIRPRLEAAEADLQSVNIVQTVHDEQEERPLILPKDIHLLAQAVQRVDAGLVIIDPLMAHLDGSVNTHRDQDVRRALTPLSTFASDYQVAVLVVRHLNKSTEGSALYRGGGSIGIIGQARVAMLMGKDPNDDARRIIAPTKNNLCPFPSSLAFRLKGVEGFDVARISWEGPVDLHASDVLNRSSGRGRNPDQREEAKAWLVAKLSSGHRQASEMYDEADSAGISRSTLKRAKNELEVESEKEDFSSGWVWRLPGSSPAG